VPATGRNFSGILNLGGKGWVPSAMVVLLAFAREMVWREKKRDSGCVSFFASQPHELYPSPRLFSFFLHSKTTIFSIVYLPYCT
jgi:hypothetical protein